jgi:predicted DNA-binding transcriptional regulator AlpA
MISKHSKPSAVPIAPAEPLLTTEHAAAVLGFHPSYLAKARLAGTGPRFLKIGAKSVRSRRAEIETWLADKSRISTSDPGA